MVVQEGKRHGNVPYNSACLLLGEHVAAVDVLEQIAAVNFLKDKAVFAAGLEELDHLQHICVAPAHAQHVHLTKDL